MLADAGYSEMVLALVITVLSAVFGICYELSRDRSERGQGEAEAAVEETRAAVGEDGSARER